MAERFLGGLAAAVSRRRRAVVAVWLVLLAAGGWFSLHQSEHLSGGGWEVPGSPSLQVADALTADFPNVTPDVFVVFVTGRTPAAVRGRLAAARRVVARDSTVKPGRATVLDGGRAARARSTTRHDFAARSCRRGRPCRPA
jgi:RND superfamily putative drug exporter